MLSNGGHSVDKVKCEGCLFGKRTQKNAVSLKAVLTEGTYFLSVFYEFFEDEAEILKDFEAFEGSLHVTVQPLMLQEDRFNCEAARLPNFLHMLMDNQGFLRYRDWVYVDLVKNKLKSSFVLDFKSVFRMVSVEPSGVDVGLYLYYNQNLIGQSNIIGGSEGLLHELDQGYYELEISFENSFLQETREKFCETVLIEIGISPQQAITSFNGHYKLDDCQDNTQELKDWFGSLKNNSLTGKVQLSPTNTYFTLPVSDLAESEKIIFLSEFFISKSVFAYFEVYSDFVASGLSISLARLVKNSENVIKGAGDALLLGEHDQKTFSAELKPGTYSFFIKSAANAQVMKPDQDAYEAFNAGVKYGVLTNCAAFQLKIQFIPISPKALKKWACRGTDFKLLPKTLNTIDKLGVKGSGQNFMPHTLYFSSAVAAPNSFNNVTDSTQFFIQSESLLRIVTQTEDAPMILSLYKDNTLLAEIRDQKPFVYSLSQKLAAQSTYKLMISYFQSSPKCQTYSILLVITPTSRLTKKSQTCHELRPNQYAIFERYLQLSGIFDPFAENENGLIDLEPFFDYKVQDKPYEALIELDVYFDETLVTGHLLFNFALSNLVLEILSKNEIIEWGSYKSPYRYELEPVPLTKGNYQVRIRELTLNPIQACASYKLSIIKEDLQSWNDVSSMVRTPLTCNFPDLPEDLNAAGLMSPYSIIEFHQTLKIDSFVGQSSLNFFVSGPSIIYASITPIQNIRFYMKVYKYMEYQTLLEGAETLKGVVEDGVYQIEISYKSNFTLPSPKLCPGFELTLSVMPDYEYENRASFYSCSDSQELPDQLVEDYAEHLLVFGKIEKEVKIVLQESSEINVFVGFQHILSGYVRVQLLDGQKQLLKVSSGDFTFSHLKFNLPSGVFYLRIYSETAYLNKCWQLNFKYFRAYGQACLGRVLPSELPKTDNEKLYFDGKFAVDSDKPEQIIEFSVEANSIIKVLTISNGRFRIESAIYKTDAMNKPEVYSNNKNQYGSIAVELFKQPSPYFLVLNHIIEESKGCLLYDLMIEAKSFSEISKQLQCKIEKNLLSLPPVLFELAEDQTVQLKNLAVLDDWIIGSQAPKGVLSKGTENESFIYEIELNLKNTGKLSIQVSFDFLTNDLSLEIFNTRSLIARSTLEKTQKSSKSSGFSISTSINSLSLTPGEYKLRMTQGPLADQLIRKFADVEICFPFEFSLQFNKISTKILNRIIKTSPSQSKLHNPLVNLLISFEFVSPVNKDELTVHLISGSNSIKAELLIDPVSDTKVKAKFLSEQLEAGICYKLILESENIELDKEPHDYCTLACKCNPVADAKCNYNSCVCPSPFTGTQCYECLSGYILENRNCVNTINQQPMIISVSFDKNTKNNEAVVYVIFSSDVYDKFGEKIENRNSQALKNSFTLENEGKYIEPTQATMVAKDSTKWAFIFSLIGLNLESGYQLQINPGNLFSISSLDLLFGTKEELDLVFPYAPNGVNDCNNHGEFLSSHCKCDLGYSGFTCFACSSGYYKTAMKTCQEQLHFRPKDNLAYLKSISPSGFTVINFSKNIVLDIELSKTPYNEHGDVVHKLVDPQIIKHAFVLQDTNLVEFIQPAKAEATDSEGKSWRLEFETKELRSDTAYTVVQMENVLFSKDGNGFLGPSIKLPVFRVVFDSQCENGRLVGDECECDKGFVGKFCDKCYEGLRKNLAGRCVTDNFVNIEQKFDNSVFSTIVYCIVYFIVGMIIAYFISTSRKRNNMFTELEMSTSVRNEVKEINLYQ